MGEFISTSSTSLRRQVDFFVCLIEVEDRSRGEEKRRRGGLVFVITLPAFPHRMTDYSTAMDTIGIVVAIAVAVDAGD